MNALSTVEVDRSDLEKIADVLAAAVKHHRLKDEANAAAHLNPIVRFSPLTSELMAADARLGAILHPGRSA